MLKTLLMVPVIMVCALGGTVGLLTIIKKITPGEGFPKDSIARELENKGKKSN